MAKQELSKDSQELLKKILNAYKPTKEEQQAVSNLLIRVIRYDHFNLFS